MQINIEDYVTIATIQCYVAGERNKYDYHRIGVRCDGRLVVFDHPALTSEIQLYQMLDPANAAAEAQPHTCATTVRQWEQGSWGLPSPLAYARSILDEQRKKMLKERQDRRCFDHKKKGYSASCPHCSQDPLRETFSNRICDRTKRALSASLKRVDKIKKGDKHQYAVFVGRWQCSECSAAVRATTLDTSGQRVSMCCHAPLRHGAWARTISEKEWDKDKNYDGGGYRRVTTTEINVTPAWYARVYRHGLAVVDGYLVLDAQPYHDHRGERFRIRVAAPSRGYTLVVKQAWYRPSKGKLKWI